MTQYLLSLYQPDGDIKGGKPPPPEVLQKIMRDVNALRQEMIDAGVWVFSGGLHHPSSATVVHAREGEVLTTDGPFIESKEHIGGFNIIKANDLDAALVWARKFTKATHLPVEVRPFRDATG